MEAPPPPPAWLEVSEEVRAAVTGRTPVVALESTVVGHGLPWPDNLEVALLCEAAVREEGAAPATVALLRGRLRVGLRVEELEHVARGPLAKAGLCDLGALIAARADGATTVSSTVFAAARAGVRLVATGGIGGVHRGGAMDVSSDLLALAENEVAVVCSGAKSILDLPRTLELLETLCVPIIGYGTNELPAFYARASGLPLEHRVDTPEQAAALLCAHLSLATGRGVVFANPIAEAHALPAERIEGALRAALAEAAARGVSGKRTTPFLLGALHRATGNESVRANRALLVDNARLAARVAAALCAGHGRHEERAWRKSAS